MKITFSYLEILREKNSLGGEFRPDPDPALCCRIIRYPTKKTANPIHSYFGF